MKASETHTTNLFGFRKNVSYIGPEDRGSDCTCCWRRKRRYQSCCFCCSRSIWWGTMAKDEPICIGFLFPISFLFLVTTYVEPDRYTHTHARTQPHTYQWPGRYFPFKMCSKNFLTLLSMFYFVQERSKIIYRFADLIEKHKDELAALEVWDNGKPYEQAASVEIPMLVRLFRYYAGERHWIWSTNYYVRILILSSCIWWHRLSRASFSWLGSKESLRTWWCLLVITMSANVDHICMVRITLLV